VLAFPYGTMEVVVAQKITARQNKFEKSSGCVAQVVNVNFVLCRAGGECEFCWNYSTKISQI
jgi:hypothetical protein